MSYIKIIDKEFDIFIDEQKINDKVKELGQQISRDYHGLNPLLLCLLKGSFIFTADLLRAIKEPVEVTFIRLNSYQGTSSSGEVTTLMEITDSLKDRHVLIVEDIIDTGRTIYELNKQLKEAGAASIKLASLLVKPTSLQFDVSIDYIGFEIPDKFVVGYGMDYNEAGRNLKGIYAATENIN